MASDPDAEGGRLGRWSRRKLAARTGTELPEPDLELDPSSPAPDAAEMEANRLEAEAIDPDTLGPDSDLTVFLRDGVPQILRQRALRAVWRSDPVFANLDGLVDHGEDFRNPGMVMKTFTSAWKIGSGYLRAKIDEAEGQIEAEASPAPDTEMTGLDPVAGKADPQPEHSGSEHPPRLAARAPKPEAALPSRASLRRRLALDDGGTGT